MTSKITETETTVENYEKICGNRSIQGVNKGQTTVVVYSKTTNDEIAIAAYNRGYYDGYADAELFYDD